MKKKIKTDAVFVLNQPKHPIASVIIVDSSKPLIPEAHETIDRLRTITDLMFVFSEHFDLQHISIPKFASLYGACSYIVGSGKILGKPVMDILSYCREVFGQHVSFVITDTDRCEKIGPMKNLETILDLTSAPVVAPVLSIRRLGADELSDIYFNQETSPRLETWKFWEAPKDTENQDRIGSTHVVDGYFMFMRSSIVDEILQNMSDLDFIKYLETFVESDIGFLMGSLITKLGIKYINTDLMNIDLRSTLNYG